MMIRRVLVLAAVVVCANALSTMAQEAGSDGSNLVWNATSSAALQTRAPGHLIDAGVARHNEFNARAFSRPEITEQADDTPGLQTRLQIIAIETLFQNLNAALLAFDNLIRAQAGFAPFLGLPITPGLPNSLL